MTRANVSGSPISGRSAAISVLSEGQKRPGGYRTSPSFGLRCVSARSPLRPPGEDGHAASAGIPYGVERVCGRVDAFRDKDAPIGSARADPIATTPRAKVLSSISHLEVREGRVYCGSEMRLLEFLSPSSFSSCMPRSLHILRTYQHAPRGWRIRESTFPTPICAAATTTATPLPRTWSSR